MEVKLVWATPNGDDLLAYMARVSNPENQDNKTTAPKLIRYLIDHKHWSPFEMVNACVEIRCTRDIGRQILRHRSFSFQEFSQRYAEVDKLETYREVRLLDSKNRQNSLDCDDRDTRREFLHLVEGVADHNLAAYKRALDIGVAKEQARALLPEGLTPSTLYVNGTLRSWIHYWSVRCTPETQKEHRLLAEECREIILPQFPSIAQCLTAP